MQQQLELWSASPKPEMSGECNNIISKADAPTVTINAAEVEWVGRSDLDMLAVEYLKAARSQRTRDAYATDWRLFERWCTKHGESPLPAVPMTLARYLVDLAQQGKRASTIRRARIAIGVLHGQRGLPRPDHDDRIRTLERGIGRIHGSREEGAKPLMVPELERMVSALANSVRDERDRALLLLGFAGAFRASEIVGLDVTDLEPHSDGLRVRLRRSKEDPLGRGSITDIPRADNALLCPVQALERWLKRIPAVGPLFRGVYGDRVSTERLAPRAVSRAVQRAAARVGLSDYSAHSLRSGLATSAHTQGCSVHDIQAHGRWKDVRSLERYIHVSADAARRTLGRLL
jgi:site-specific recombinase XerD